MRIHSLSSVNVHRQTFGRTSNQEPKKPQVTTLKEVDDKCCERDLDRYQRLEFQNKVIIKNQEVIDGKLDKTMETLDLIRRLSYGI